MILEFAFNNDLMFPQFDAEDGDSATKTIGRSLEKLLRHLLKREDPPLPVGCQFSKPQLMDRGQIRPGSWNP